MKMFISQNNKIINWQDYTLIIPCISVGNVGQLSADLLISTMWMEKVGYFYDDSVVPLIGNDPFASGDLTKTCNLMTSFEVFESSDHKVICLQQRSAFVKGKSKEFVEKLMDWIEHHKFTKVVILTSSFAHERVDCQLSGPQMRFLLSPKFESSDGDILRKNLNWIELEKRAIDDDSKDNVTLDMSDLSSYYIPGSGIAKKVFEKCSGEGRSVCLLLKFVAEGDNTMDAIKLATYLNSWQNWINLEKCSNLSGHESNGWKLPSSWQHLFGSKTSADLF